jgi:hypothetical protein
MRRSARTHSLLAGFGAALFTTLAPLTENVAHAFCRTTTAKVPADYDPASCGCWTYGLPLFWSNACVSYDLQQDATPQVPYATAASNLATAFSKWTGTTCSPDSGTGRVSIDVRDLGAVSCGIVEYNQFGENQHVIVFRTSDFPGDAKNALALTTVTYNIDTGEIYDADMEINASPGTVLSTSETVPAGDYDFLSIVTHETGHFLGMAHAVDTSATMYWSIGTGQDSERLLTLDDVNGICAIYPPDGTRTVAAVDGGPYDSGAPTAACVLTQPTPVATHSIPEVQCDPTPRHGFTTECLASDGGAPSGGCEVTPLKANGGSSWAAGAGSMGLLTLAAAFVRARHNRRRSGRSG